MRAPSMPRQRLAPAGRRPGEPTKLPASPLSRRSSARAFSTTAARSGRRSALALEAQFFSELLGARGADRGLHLLLLFGWR
jgi:hypothetical protein